MLHPYEQSIEWGTPLLIAVSSEKKQMVRVWVALNCFDFFACRQHSTLTNLSLVRYSTDKSRALDIHFRKRSEVSPMW
jgi:hypothetical protein